MTKVCVFGGAGFLGSHVADELSRRGSHVRIFDRTPSKWAHERQEIQVGDILDYEAVCEAARGCDVVYNFAALADLNQCINLPRETVEVNVLGNINILEACRRHGIGRFMYASTMYVYSKSGGFYRCSKKASELYVEEYGRCYNIDYTILRYGSLYGPRSDEANGVFRIINEALKSGSINYSGSSDSMREYVHVHDAAVASVDALFGELSTKSLVITGQESMKVRDFLYMIAEILEIGPERVNFSATDDTAHYVRTPYSYQRDFGKKYIPSVHIDLGRGILDTIDYIASNENLRHF